MIFSEGHWKKLPATIADAVGNMLKEIEVNGEHTTADETAAAVEAVFSFLGRVWIAEYLNALSCGTVKPDVSLNKDLLENLKREILTGQWISMSRRARSALISSSAVTVYSGLAAVDFGEFGDKSHAIARLSAFRNHFSHGSFKTTVAQISEHRRLLEQLLEKLPCLVNQRILVKAGETGQHYEARGEWSAVPAPSGDPLPVSHPVVLASDGRRLDLYPMLAYVYQNGHRLIAPDNKIVIAGINSHEAMSVWAQRYDYERQGHIDYAAGRTQTVLPEPVKSELRQCFSAGKCLILVESHPGCGAESIIESLGADDPHKLGLSQFSAIRRISVFRDEVSQSGYSAAQAVLRTVETALGQPDGYYQASLADILSAAGSLSKSAGELKKSGKRILLVLDSIQNGMTPYRGEPLTVLDVYRRLADTGITVVAVSIAGCINKPIFDQKIVYPVAAEPDKNAVAQWKQNLAGKSPLHAAVLAQIAGSDSPLHLFEICEALETEGGHVFEPAVERALWDMRPLLVSAHEERLIDGNRENTRVWRPFSPVLRRIDINSGGKL